MRGEWARGVSALILRLMGRGVIVFSARIVIFVVGPAAGAGSAIGQSLLGSGKGVGQSSPFTVGIGPVTVVAGTIRCCVGLSASGIGRQQAPCRAAGI